ncbi:hypothetical protein SO694_00015455 [Aureococcus anophagefferens]|uniref:SGNH hydrolase-type esterase domain-containing protein n=1 Tax=Aureococcus anophagefferens TaxID=44056 RepID=A0ABR1G344_AURAN
MRLPILLVAALRAASAARLDAGDALVSWAGRRVCASGSVSFDWVGVAARVKVVNATFVRAVVATSAPFRGTRLKAYGSDAGYLMMPTVQFWVDARGGSDRRPTNARARSIDARPRSDPTPSPSVGSDAYALWLAERPRDVIATVENLVSPQYGTGVTTVRRFETDGAFAALAPAERLGGADGRSIEFVGDSITAATNVVRPPGVAACADAGYESDWSQSYGGLLARRFNAAASAVAVGGKCVTERCGASLQMPDYYGSAFYADAPARTFDFADAPDAVFVNLGTNDNLRIKTAADMEQFADASVDFLVNATEFYGSRAVDFFLSAGPMENRTADATLNAVRRARDLGLKATFVDLRAACAGLPRHESAADLCDGCANHPGVGGHAAMYEAAAPVLSRVLGWD